ncbi:hypothetical protein [Photobacterium sp. TY1-4]|uniref:hypothetical protein n=1 Tax=Photobacterium sp. TY1-4 TaxID=2899122 RepID=UPI0021BF29B8|nr:hypothetical protein [Photobacterium sp. TY1-4]UXI03700.1 hypothetical protein NH461_25130 [Photobacterium sp. TY1-4]
MTKQRGIIFCPEFEDLNGDVYIPHVQIRKEQIQFFCLYWDYIIQPVTAQLPRWKRTTDELMLEEASILIKDYQDYPTEGQQTFVKEYAYSLKSDGAHNWVKSFIEYQNQALNKAQREQPNVIWTPQQSYRRFLSTPEISSDVYCIQMELHKKLPVPSQGSSAKEIVAFKHDNSHLFRELKHSIDRLAHFVSQANEASEFSLDLATTDLEKAIEEIKGKSRQRFGSLVQFEGIKINLGSNNLASNLDSVIKGATIAGSTSLSPLNAILGGALGALASFISLTPVKSKKLYCIPEAQLELSYLTKGYQSGLLKK